MTIAESIELLNQITGFTDIGTFVLIVERVDEDGIPSTQVFAPHQTRETIQIIAAGLMSLALGPVPSLRARA